LRHILYKIVNLSRSLKTGRPESAPPAPYVDEWVLCLFSDYTGNCRLVQTLVGSGGNRLLWFSETISEMVTRWFVGWY